MVPLHHTVNSFSPPRLPLILIRKTEDGDVLTAAETLLAGMKKKTKKSKSSSPVKPSEMEYDMSEFDDFDSNVTPILVWFQ